ncbi:hypothetical protein E3E26_07325 [Thermococcus sp. LS1]|uniref:hypothetical protein n=1 Tax=Thermococcus sp. LS1 TaxID=1638259 RepID=UPI00143BB062|nr:hypothetical protein [Thermococcus sp. LS1]NJD99593.1 hypothetical protein [Thermococcus sp. LS1]
MGPYLPQSFYAETPGYVEYMNIALWLVLLAVVLFSMYSLHKSLAAITEELRGINEAATELRRQTVEVEKILEEV